jgi:ADP-ribosylglycohydrolase
MNVNNDIDFQEKYRAVMLGAAYGDTLGMCVEMWKPEQIRKYIGKVTEPRMQLAICNAAGEIITRDEYGKLRYYHLQRKTGEVTDDTIFSRALGEALVERGYDLDHAAKKHFEYFDKFIDRGFGKTTQIAMENLRSGLSPNESGIIGGAGTGPPMKMHPLGIYMHSTNTYEEGLRFAKEVGKITHLDPRSVAGGIMQAHAVFYILGRAKKDMFLESLVEMSRSVEEQVTSNFSRWEDGSLTSRLRWVLENKDADVSDAYRLLGSSSLVYSAQPFALFMFQKYWDEPLEGLLQTVNFGGDSDTTGTIFGALAGARHGAFFPEEWPLEMKGELEAIAHGLWQKYR